MGAKVLKEGRMNRELRPCHFRSVVFVHLYQCRFVFCLTVLVFDLVMFNFERCYSLDHPDSMFETLILFHVTPQMNLQIHCFCIIAESALIIHAGL